MNPYHHDFFGLGSTSHTSASARTNDKRAMSEIVMPHNVSHGLTTSYDYMQDETPEQRQQRQRNIAMAKAEAITNRYSHMISTSSNIKRPASSSSSPSRPAHMQQQQQHKSAGSLSLSTATTAPAAAAAAAAARASSNNSPTPSNVSGGRDRPRRMSSEPDGLALSESFRKSITSLASNPDDEDQKSSAGARHSEQDNPPPPPPPPPLKTEVTSLLLTPKHERPSSESSTTEGRDDTFPSNQCPPAPEWTAEVTDKVTNPPLKMPAGTPPSSQHQSPPPRPTSQPYYQQPRRVSDSFASSQRRSYRERPSFQANDNYSSSSSNNKSHTVPVLPSRKSIPLYPNQSQTLGNMSNNNGSSHHNARFIASFAIEEQSRILDELQAATKKPGMVRDYHNATIHHQSNNSNNSNNSQTLAILEQEKLWRELSHRSIGTATTAAASRSNTSSPLPPPWHLSPQEEQARLWEQIQLEQSQTYHHHFLGSSLQFDTNIMTGNNNSDDDGFGMATNDRGYASMSNVVSPIEEQARLLESFQRQRTRNPVNNSYYDTDCASTSVLSTVEAQERMLQSLALSARPSDPAATTTHTTATPTAAVCPLQEQANRLREIQDEKEQQIVEMACKLSVAAEERPPPPSADEEMSLEYIMDLSRREALQAQAKAELADEQALQVALSHSRGEVVAVVATLVDESAEPEQQEGSNSSDLELRRTIAELACQSSDRTLESASERPPANLSFPTPDSRKSHRRPWGLAAFRRR